MLGLLTAISLALVLARSAVTRADWTTMMAWNIALAWLPVAFAWLARTSRVWWIPWLAFLPNAPYLTTELVHLHPGPAFWLDALVIAAVGVLGLALGVVALEPPHAAIERRFGSVAGWTFVVGITLVSGFGMYLGRVRRWNSWDLATNPMATIGDAIGRLGDPRALAITAAAFALYLSAYAITRGETRAWSSS